MKVRRPRSLRDTVAATLGVNADIAAPGTVAAAALLAAGASTPAEAQQANPTLPPVTVDAPRAKPRPVTVAPKPTASQLRARTALRRNVRQTAARPQPVAGAATATPITLPILAQGGSVDANPYAQPGAPYKVNRVQSNKFPEPIVNTPRTITVLPKEVLADKGETTLCEIGRSTAGITLGTGEGGIAFGDRFFIRGFDVRNDIFVDGIRDPGVSVRENFFTEQVEILRGPGSSFAGRGTAGGAINIVTKQASFDRDFRIVEMQGSPSDSTKRMTVDVNQVISPVLAVRAAGLYQSGGVAGRQFVTDNRWGGHASVVFKPIENLTLTATYTHTDLSGLPDFGVPYNRGTLRPLTEGVIPRYTYYGFINRDFQKIRQNMGTITGEYKFNENITLSTKFRRSTSMLNYVGTLAESPNLAALTVNSNPQSRYQPSGMFANQTEAVVKFDTGPVRHTSVVGMEFSHEQVLRDTYTGLASESVGIGAFTGRGSVVQFLMAPYAALPFGTQPTVAGTPTNISVDTKSGYLIHTANYQDYIILNGGIRLDDYNISSNAPANYFINLVQGTINKNPATINSAAQTFAQNHSSMLNYNFGAVWKPIPIISIYGAYATSSNPVGAELDGSAANYGGLSYAAQIFSPEKNVGIEAGVKAELFDRKLLATAAVFQTTKTNAREVIGTQTLANAAYRVQGLDFEVAGKITDEWSVIGGAVFMNSVITQSAAPSNIGLPLANIAHTSFSLLSKYQVLPWLELGGQAVYNSRRYGGSLLAANGGQSINGNTFYPTITPNAPFLNVPNVLPSYWRFDSFAEFKMADGIKGKFAVYNIFNRTYYDAFYQSAAPFAQMAPGRVIQFTATATF